jgi:hypothetical protein
VNKGMYKCLEKESITHCNSDKTHKLSLVECDLRESGTGDNKTYIIDHLCTACLQKYHIQYNLPLFWQGLLFLCKASIEVIKMQKALDMNFCVDTHPTSPTDSTPRGKVGKSFLSRKVQQLVVMCKLDKAEKFTGCSARRSSIGKMATSRVASGENLGDTRRKSV